MNTTLEEYVFAIPTAELWKILTYNEEGLIKGNRNDLQRIVQHGSFHRRSALEEDPSFKQIIPYGIISHDESYYLFKRTSGQTEKRLLNQLHLGVGGHMNPGGTGVLDEQYLIGELKREFLEEVRLFNGCVIENIAFIGLINDDSIPVSRVHLGLLYDIRVSSTNVAIHETDKMEAAWIAKADLAAYYNRMETWTRIAFDWYIKR
jgi:predicted NUDIX family phosphoesterase